MATTNRSLSLDGIRGVALAAPIVVHLGLAGGGNGLWMAIGMFFTLSGFLITSLALKEIDRTGRLSMKGFYARRLRRLMPGAILVLGVIVVLARWVEWPVMEAVRRDVFAALTWSANWEQMGRGGYWESFVPSLTLHFWSLSLEEQIYVAFPLLLGACLLLRRWGRPAVRIAVLMGAITALSWLMLWSTNDVSTLYLSTWTRMGEATFGCMVAAIAHLVPAKRTDRQAGAAILVMMLLAAPLWAFAVGNEPWGMRLGILAGTPLSAGVIALLWRHPGSWPARAFSLRIPAWLGRRSYGIYLIHLPMIDLMAFRMHVNRLPAWAMVVAVVATLVLAGLLFRFVEEPVRVGRVAVGPHRFAVLVGTSALVLAGVTVAVSADAPSALHIPDSVVPPPGSDLPDFTLPPDTTGATGTRLQSAAPPTSPGHLLVIGDSTAWVDFGAVRDSMTPLGWEVQEVHMVGCPPGGDARMKASVNGMEVITREIGDEPGCDEWWNQGLPQWLVSFQPDLVVLIGGYGFAYEIDPNGDDQWCRLGDGSGRCETWAAARLEALSTRIHTYAPAAHVVLTTGGHIDPYGPLDVPGSAIDVYNTLVRAEAVLDEASLVDLGTWLDEHAKYMIDGTHMGVQGVTALTPWMGAELAAALASERLVT